LALHTDERKRERAVLVTPLLGVAETVQHSRESELALQI
jgi:hypothetical protein